jgi:two-component system sensor histidine kinase EvgS
MNIFNTASWRHCYAVIALRCMMVLGSMLPAWPAVAAAPMSSDWFDTHSKLTVGVIPRLPFEAVTTNGELAGLAPDLLRTLIGERQIEIVTRQFKSNDEVVQALCTGEIDLAFNLLALAGQERCLKLSTSYLEDKVALLGRAGRSNYQGPQELTHKRVGIVGGFASESVLRQRFSQAQLVSLSVDEIVPALTAGRIDVFLGTGALLDYIRVRAPFARLVLLRSFPGLSYEFRFAVGKGQNDLLAALNDGLKKLPDARRFSIISAWLGHYYNDGVHEAPQERLDLTPLEQAYLHSLPPLRMAYSADWEPISFLDDKGRPSGMLNDYLDYLSQTLGIRFQRANIDNWLDVSQEAMRGNLDAVAGVAPGNKLFDQMLFSESLGQYRLVLVQRQSDPTFSAVAEVVGARVAVVRSELIDAQIVERLLPGVRMIETDTLREALDMVKQGTVDASATSLISVDVLIKHDYAGKLKVSLALNEPLPLSLALNERYTALLPLINRALLALSESDIRQLRSKWLAPPLESSRGWHQLPWNWLLAALSMLALLLLWWRAHTHARSHAQVQQQQAQSLRDQHLLLQTVLDTVPHPMLIKGSDGKLQAVNKAYETVFNLTRQDVIGEVEIDVVPFSNVLRQKLANSRRDVSLGGQVYVEELSYVNGNGEERIARFSLVPFLRQDTQRVAGMVALLIDLTEARQAQEMAAAAGRRLRELTENLTVVVFQLQQAVNGKLSFNFVSGNATALFGIVAQSMMDDERNAMQRVLPEDRDGLLQEVRQSAATLKPARPMFRVNNGAQVLWLAGHIVPRREADGSTIWNGYWSDITKERDAASDAASAAAVAASRAKDEFLAMMSHEIRTPMNGVMGLAEVLEDTPLSSDQAGLVKMMRDSAGTMLAILDDILDYSKIEAGQLSLSYTAVDLRQLCDQAFGLLAGRAQEKRLQMRVQVDAAVAARHIVDGTRLRQLLFNLLGNAIKFTAHGSIILSIKVEYDASDHQQLRILVEDTGKGISKDQLSRLFEPFMQEDSTISHRFGGTGLGLSICRRLINLMNGEIAIHSVENFGTTAQLTLTLAVAERDCSIAVLRGRRVRLLLPDYNIRLATQMYVTALGMTVVDDASAELKIGISTRPGKIELQWHEGDETKPMTLALNANPLQWSTLRQACLVTFKGEAREVMNHPVIAAPLSPLRAARILVAEDNATNQEVIRRFLHRLSLDCDVVSNGLEAFEALRTRSYALLLTDCHMPELDGYTLARHVREIEQAHGLGRMPIVGITASTRAEDEQIARDAGMDACLFKPTGLAMLSDCLEELLPQAAALADIADEAERYKIFAGFELLGEGPISAVQLRNLSDELGEEGKWSVLRVFRDTLEQDLEVLPPFGSDALASWLHRVKGAIAVMEFSVLIAAIDEIISAGEGGQTDRQVVARNKFVSLCSKAIEQIDNLLPLPSTQSAVDGAR